MQTNEYPLSYTHMKVLLDFHFDLSLLRRGFVLEVFDRFVLLVFSPAYFVPPV